eukprot:jgi/Psemu1/17818/gm1.17818_g
MFKERHHFVLYTPCSNVVVYMEDGTSIPVANLDFSLLPLPNMALINLDAPSR